MAPSSEQPSLELSNIMNILYNYSSNLASLIYQTLQLNSTTNTASQDVTQHVYLSSRALKHNAGQVPTMRVDQRHDGRKPEKEKKLFGIILKLLGCLAKSLI